MDQSGVVETLFICRKVNVFKIPPRPGGGHKSGTWLTDDKIFTGLLRVQSQGQLCTVVLEDESGREFAQCPIPAGEKDQAVESATDSSRYFVLRLMTPGDARQKAFVGLGFEDRSEAFDFQVALTDHEKHLRRAKDAALAAQQATSPQPSTSPSMNSEAASLYQSHDLSLKQGETMKINFRKPSDSNQQSFLRSGAASGMRPPQATLKIPPPIAPGNSVPVTQPAATAPPHQAAAQPEAQGSYLTDLLGLQQSQQSKSAAPPKPSSDTPDNWATF